MSTAPSEDLTELEGVVRASSLEGRNDLDRRTVDWRCDVLEGRLAELSGAGASATLSAALQLVRNTQCEGAPAAWVTVGEVTFFPPDAQRNGVDLAALPVVRADESSMAARIADKLLRSGGFGLVVIDLAPAPETPGDEPLPAALQQRLVQHADAHDSGVLVVTEKSADAPSAARLCSLRLQTDRRREGGDRFTWELEALADKRLGPGWTHQEVYRGPPGLR